MGAWKRYGLPIGFIGACVLSGVVGGALTNNFGTSSYTLSYADFVSILLTAISLLVTLLGIVLAVVALIGWNAISEKVKSNTESYLEEGFKEGNDLHTMLRVRATEIMYAGVTPIEDQENPLDPDAEVVE